MKMKLLDRLERRYQRYAIPNLTVMIVIMQVAFYLMLALETVTYSDIVFIPAKLLDWEWFRLITFVFIPPVTNPLFAFFAWYIFYLMGSSLEDHWGTFKYNIYLLIAYLATILAACLNIYAPASNGYIMGSVFLAFAYLYPDFELYLFFILPVKIKWLALITWIGYGFNFLFGPMESKLMIVASVANFLLFFSRDIYLQIKAGRRKMKVQAQNFAIKNTALHQCVKCGITEKTNPEMSFLYCSDCDPTSCYCKEHIEDHEHIAKENDEQKPPKNLDPKQLRNPKF